MVIQRLLQIVCVATLALVTVRPAEARGPSTPEERQQAVTLVRLLETQPLSKEAKDARAWLTLWLIEIPDISVTMCPALLGPDFDSDRKYGPELMVQQGYSAAAFKIEHPEQASDDLAVNTASVEGVLRAYQAIRAKHPKAKFSSLDALLQAQESGQLQARVGELSKSCQ